MDGVSQRLINEAGEILDGSQRELFEGARLPKEIERKYTFDQIAACLRAANGNQTLTARYLGASRTTIQKRLKSNQRLREVQAQAKESIIDISEIIVTDPLKRPCVYCRVPMIDVAQWFEQCAVRVREEARPVKSAPAGHESDASQWSLDGNDNERISGPKFRERSERFLDGSLYSVRDDGHVAFINIDPTERRQIAFGILRTLGGWSVDKQMLTEIPDEVLDAIPVSAIPSVMKMIAAGEKIEAIKERIELIIKSETLKLSA